MSELLNFDLENLENKDSLKFPKVTYNKLSYFSINDIVKEADVWVLFKNDGVLFYSNYNIKGIEPEEEYIISEDVDMACLRLEDVRAEPTEDSIYNHSNLEKFRAMGSWLSARNQRYSIAWIPLYVNPILNIENNLLTDFNFYNSDFIYTLDYLVDNGAEIGLHGLTHQSGDEVSSVGDEFGANTIFSNEEIRERMTEAINISEKLGYDYKFFEFPHYAITPEQLLIAEELFDAIYQNYPNINDHLEIVNETLYIPTPADHVISKFDRENRVDIIKNLESDKLTSLFFHPHLDWEYITGYTEIITDNLNNDIDSDSNIDINSDIDSDIDSDINIDSDSDINIDSDIDSDINIDSDSDINIDSDIDSDINIDIDSDDSQIQVTRVINYLGGSILDDIYKTVVDKGLSFKTPW